MYSRSVHLRNFNSYSSQSNDLIFFTGEIDSKLSPLKTLQLNGCHNCHDAKMTTCWEVFLGYVISSHVFFCSYDVWVETWLFSYGVACWGQCKMDKFWLALTFVNHWLLLVRRIVPIIVRHIFAAYLIYIFKCMLVAYSQNVCGIFAAYLICCFESFLPHIHWIFAGCSLKVFAADLICMWKVNISRTSREYWSAI